MNIRNKPCPCGSEKKFKRCCWRPDDVREAREIQLARYRAVQEARIKKEKEEQEAKERLNKSLEDKGAEILYKPQFKRTMKPTADVDVDGRGPCWWSGIS